MMFEKTKTKVLEYIKENGLIKKGDKVLIAVSGGPDSIFLLHLLAQYKNELGICIICCHINHNLRGEDSDRDERLVKNTVERMEIPFFTRKIDVSSFGKEHHLSLEDAARRLRIKIFEEIADETDAQRIALGHTSDDLLETFFLNLVRGAGRKGLLTMNSKRERFIRPLLSISKKEIVTYLKGRNIDYRIDVTNWMTRYRRNFIRRELIPLIERNMNSGLKKNILQLLDILREEEAVFDTIVQGEMKKTCGETDEGMFIKRPLFRNLKSAIQRRIIIECFENVATCEKKLHFSEIESLRNAIKGRTSGLTFAFYGTTFLVGADGVLIKNCKESKPKKTNETIIKIPGTVTFQNRYYIKTSLLNAPNGDIKASNCAYFDLDAVHQPIVLRKRNNGDIFKPFGMQHSKKIKDFFIDEKVPFWKRDNIPLVVDSKDILWIVGLRRSDVAKVQENTERILKMEEEKIAE